MLFNWISFNHKYYYLEKKNTGFIISHFTTLAPTLRSKSEFMRTLGRDRVGGDLLKAFWGHLAVFLSFMSRYKGLKKKKKVILGAFLLFLFSLQKFVNTKSFWKLIFVICQTHRILHLQRLGDKNRSVSC